MSKNKAEEFRVLLTEDEEDWVKTIKEIIEEVGGVLVETCGTLEDAMLAMSVLEELKIDIIILGGNLGGFKPGNTDSLTILEELFKQQLAGNERARQIKTIGFSGDLVSRSKFTDVDLGKQRVLELGPTMLRLMAEAKEKIKVSKPKKRKRASAKKS